MRSLNCPTRGNDDGLGMEGWIFRRHDAHRRAFAAAKVADLAPNITSQRINSATYNSHVVGRCNRQAGRQVKPGEGARLLAGGWNVVNASEVLEGQPGIPPQQRGTESCAPGE